MGEFILSKQSWKNWCFPKMLGPTTNDKEAKVEWFYEDLQGLLGVITKKMSFSS